MTGAVTPSGRLLASVRTSRRSASYVDRRESLVVGAAITGSNWPAMFNNELVLLPAPYSFFPLRSPITRSLKYVPPAAYIPIAQLNLGVLFQAKDFFGKIQYKSKIWYIFMPKLFSNVQLK